MEQPIYTYEGNFDNLVELDRIPCSMVEYAQEVRKQLLLEKSKIPINHKLIFTLENAARAGWEVILMGQ